MNECICIFQIVANIAVVIGANIIGMYRKYLSDLTNRLTFTETRNCIEARIKLEHERQQQVEF